MPKAEAVVTVEDRGESTAAFVAEELGLCIELSLEIRVYSQLIPNQVHDEDLRLDLGNSNVAMRIRV